MYPVIFGPKYGAPLVHEIDVHVRHLPAAVRNPVIIQTRPCVCSRTSFFLRDWCWEFWQPVTYEMKLSNVVKVISHSCDAAHAWHFICHGRKLDELRNCFQTLGEQIYLISLFFIQSFYYIRFSAQIKLEFYKKREILGHTIRTEQLTFLKLSNLEKIHGFILAMLLRTSDVLSFLKI